MGIGGFDVTAAASSHSALAGVLAGIVLVLLPMIASQSQAGTSAHEKLERRFSIRLLVVAMFLLVISAVVWGGVAGSPSRSDILDMAGSDGSSLATDQLARSMTIAAVATVLLSMGAMCLAVGVLNLVKNEVELDLNIFIARTIALLGTLATYEVLFFAVADAALLWSPSWRYMNELTLLLTGLAGLSFWIGTWKRVRNRPVKVVRAGAIQWREGPVVKLLAGSGTLAVVAYTLSPLPAGNKDQMQATSLDFVAVVALCASSSLAIAFLITLSWKIARLREPAELVVPPATTSASTASQDAMSDTAGVPAGGEQAR